MAVGTVRLQGEPRHIVRLTRHRPAGVPGLAAISAAFGRDVEKCLRTIGQGIAEARGRGAQLVVLPESAIGGYLFEPRERDVAAMALPPAFERTDPLLTERLVAMAGPTTVVVGYTEAEGDKRFSSAVCVSGDGVLGHQRKVHIPAGERPNFAPGERFDAFDTPVGRMGIVLCYDKVFPESAGLLARDGAQIIAAPAAWPVCRLRPARRARADREVQHFDVLDRARAMENQVVWVAANQAGRLGRLRFPGQATVIDPDGRVRARTRAGTALAHLDAAVEVSTLRAEISHGSDRVASALVVPPADAPALRAVS